MKVIDNAWLDFRQFFLAKVIFAHLRKHILTYSDNSNSNAEYTLLYCSSAEMYYQYDPDTYL